MSAQLRIGLIQFNIAWEQPRANFGHLDRIISHQDPPDLILLPEMWSTGFSMQPEKAAEKVPGPALTWMIEKSNSLQSVIAGSISVEDKGQYFNRWYCVHPDGQIQSYDKKHLFSFGTEDQHYSGGTSQIQVEVNGWKIMPIICYDLRFPVWCRNTTGYDLLIVAANWPAARIHHWDALLKARAIENQCFVAGINRIGQDGNNLEYPGHSSIYDMNGKEMLEMKDSEGMGICTLDKDQLISYRERFRFLQDQDPFRIEPGTKIVL